MSKDGLGFLRRSVCVAARAEQDWGFAGWTPTNQVVVTSKGWSTWESPVELFQTLAFDPSMSPTHTLYPTTSSLFPRVEWTSYWRVRPSVSRPGVCIQVLWTLKMIRFEGHLFNEKLQNNKYKMPETQYKMHSKNSSATKRSPSFFLITDIVLLYDCIIIYLFITLLIDPYIVSGLSLLCKIPPVVPLYICINVHAWEHICRAHF